MRLKFIPLKKNSIRKKNLSKKTFSVHENRSSSNFNKLSDKILGLASYQFT